MSKALLRARERLRASGLTVTDKDVPGLYARHLLETDEAHGERLGFITQGWEVRWSELIKLWERAEDAGVAVGGDAALVFGIREHRDALTKATEWPLDGIWSEMQRNRCPPAARKNLRCQLFADHDDAHAHAPPEPSGAGHGQDAKCWYRWNDDKAWTQQPGSERLRWCCLGMR